VVVFATTVTRTDLEYAAAYETRPALALGRYALKLTVPDALPTGTRKEYAPALLDVFEPTATQRDPADRWIVTLRLAAGPTRPATETVAPAVTRPDATESVTLERGAASAADAAMSDPAITHTAATDAAITRFKTVPPR